MPDPVFWRFSRLALLLAFSGIIASATVQPSEPLFRVVDMDIAESRQVELSNGERVDVTVVSLKERRDPVSKAVREAWVTVEIDGERVELVSATYHRPVMVGAVQIDCPVTSGYNSNGSPTSWGLEKSVRLRLWPKGSPLLRPGSFIYPAQQRWFATHTQMANEPTYVDGGESAGRKQIYYHSGLDIGGSEGLVNIIAATDGTVVSAGDQVLAAHKADTPVSPRYDVVYLLDDRGWYYRYSHLKSIEATIRLGARVKMGDPIGTLGKEGASGGWSHLHFEIKCRQPSGLWGTQEGYAFLWEAYQKEYQPELIAVARPHHLIWAGETVTLDGRKSWTSARKIARYEWAFHDGSQAVGPSVKRRYHTPGTYSEVMKITDSDGKVAYDFSVVEVHDKKNPRNLPPTVHPNYYPTTGIRAGDPVTFKVRSFRATVGQEQWDFGDGSPLATSLSDGNAKAHDPDGYAVITRSFKEPGDYIVTVERVNEHGYKGYGRLHVRVEP